MSESRQGITVYGASSPRISEEYFTAARAVGREIALAGVPLINGAGSRGLMGASIEGAREAGGECIGVIPRFMAEKGWQHPLLTELRVTETMHERKALMASLARGVIALPGGIGTFDELCEIITWRQLGLFKGPVVLLDTLGYYRPFMEMLRHAEEQDFMRPVKRTLYTVTEDPVEAVRMALNE